MSCLQQSVGLKCSPGSLWLCRSQCRAPPGLLARKMAGILLAFLIIYPVKITRGAE